MKIEQLGDGRVRITGKTKEGKSFCFQAKAVKVVHRSKSQDWLGRLLPPTDEEIRNN